MQIDLAVPGQLTFALGPDLFLMVGAMVLLLWAAWRPESEAHQRAVGVASTLLTVATIGLVIWYAVRGFGAGPGVVAVDNFRWASDLIFLIGTLIALALSIDYNAREGILAAE